MNHETPLSRIRLGGQPDPTETVAAILRGEIRRPDDAARQVESIARLADGFWRHWCKQNRRAPPTTCVPGAVAAVRAWFDPAATTADRQKIRDSLTLIASYAARESLEASERLASN